MFSFIGKILKFAIATSFLVGIAGVAAFATLGPGRTHAVLGEMQTSLLEAVDDNIDDPAALRAQIREMEKEYPERIAQVRSDLAEVQSEIAALDREVAVSERVVALADQDLDRLQDQLAMQLPEDGARLVARGVITLDGHTYTPARAKVRLNQVRATRIAYANRAADARHDRGYLVKQQERLEDLLVKLEAERSEFQTQALALGRQIDSIARNDRLIQLLDRRNRTIDECSRYDSVSIDQITGRLAQVKSRQEAELELLSSQDNQADYEDLARMQLATENLEAQHEGNLALDQGGRSDL
ncbi:MAG TPA: hypothetical protein ENJ09_08505 [Planctomycetes bacterium]|nr:hypothetical protein [Planctomycetota bacterium]